MHEALVLIPIIIANIVIAGLSVLIYRQLSEHGDTAMAKLKLQPGKTVNDFKILLISHSFETTVLFVVLAAGLLQMPRLVDLGRQLSAVYGIAFAIVFYRWYRRF